MTHKLHLDSYVAITGFNQEGGKSEQGIIRIFYCVVYTYTPLLAEIGGLKDSIPRLNL
jgi:hypothetical protein